MNSRAVVFIGNARRIKDHIINHFKELSSIQKLVI